MQKIGKSLIAMCLFLIPILWMCSDGVTSSTENYSHQTFDELSLILENAYISQSQDSLISVFKTWQQILPPYSFAEYSAFSDTVRYVYEVFREFYTPTDLTRITNGRHENFETDFWYIVKQNSLNYSVLDIDFENVTFPGDDSGGFEIQDFRPISNDASFPSVFLSAEADSMIRRFLYEPDGAYKTDHGERTTFLRQAMQLTHHHWIADYHKATMPIVSRIYLNSNFTQALVDFRVFYQFGEAYLERTGNGWQLVSSILPIIE